MNVNAQFHRNFAKIDSLAISDYEKEIIRSAYYNHLNKIPIAPNANALLKQYDITFHNGEIQINNIDREARKKLYKRRSNAESMPTQTKGIYAKSFLQTNNKQSHTLMLFLTKGEKLYTETQKLIIECDKLTHVCFKKGERSYSMTMNIIEKIRESMQIASQTLYEFLQPFLELFEDLQPQAQQEILQKSHTFITKLQQAKDTSATLCIKLSTIRAHYAMSKENDFIQYLEYTIMQFDNYVRS